MDDPRLYTQALVIGAGIAGCTTALILADQGVEVTLLSAGNNLDTGNTALAQGGIVFQDSEKDPLQLEKDMLVAGWKHNYSKAVRFLCSNGPAAVREILIERLNIPFVHSKENSCEWDMRLEGGHGAKRILHCADFTGRAIMDGLMQAVKDAPNIRVLLHRTAVDLLTSHHHARSMEYKYQLTNQCVGAYVLNEQTNNVETILADYTLLATGGVGQIYLHSTNSASSIGSGLTMAYRSGARVINTEYVQFHPTALYHRADRRFLITEAMRGAGARLVNEKGEPFMSNYDPRADLAPRDIVSRAIMDEMLKTKTACVYLDAANYATEDVTENFPTIYKKCLEIGVDIRKDPIPVVPAAHYFCGGILTDTHARTTLSRLYCAGECACTGIHGANRLASTSLLEGLLWGYAAGKDISHKLYSKPSLSKNLRNAIPDWESPGHNENEDPALIAQDWATLRNTMWNYVGITRNGQRLQRAVNDLNNLYTHLLAFYKRTPLSKPILDLFHGTHAAYTITLAAQRNTQSLGCHYRED